VRLAFGWNKFLATPAGAAIARLRPGWDLVSGEGDAWTQIIRSADVLTPLYASVTEAEMRVTPARFIQQFGVGLESVDLTAARSFGFLVANLPSGMSGNADSVAEMAVTLTLQLVRQVEANRIALREGYRWEGATHALFSRQVAIVGYGAIGEAVGKRLAAFGTELIAVRTHPSRGARYASQVVGADRLGDVVSGVDGVICCASSVAGDGPLFTREVFGKFRPGSFLVNVARGRLVDEQALLEALDSGILTGAGLDVLAGEPVRPDNPLVRHPRVIATPHIGGMTVEHFSQSGALMVENIERFERGDRPLWLAADQK
jgi:phosphoglycerate dehydrogenase-like enzyme